MRLYCFPYVGGGREAFAGWSEGLRDVSTRVFEMPGRKGRFAEPLATEMAPCVREFVDSIVEEEPAAYALFGHSLGAKVAFEVAMEIQRRGLYPPCHLFVSCSIAPHVAPVRTTHTLSDDAFIEELRKMGGAPEQVLSDKTLMELLLPPLRADARISELYRRPIGDTLRVPMTVLLAKTDPYIPAEDAKGWKHFARRGCQVKTIDGDHFFIIKRRESLLRIVGQVLDEYRHMLPDLAVQ